MNLAHPAIERGILHYNQGRYDMALEEFQRALAGNPQDGFAHAFAAVCLLEKADLVGASEAAARAIESAPDMPFAHYAAASAFHRRNRFKEAERAIDEAIRLAPENSAQHGLAALLRFGQSDWKGALTRATKGLEMDPESSLCANVRAMALVKLGQVGDARTELETSLRHEPENSLTHANLGWSALERGQRQQALESFREALRIDPTSDWARGGMIHALKLRYPLYGLFLRYMLWMQRLGRRAQMGVIIGGYIGFRLLNGVAQNQPDLRPWLMPFLIAYIAFAYMSWVSRPVTNLFLRFNRFGRAILDPDERRESNLVGSALLGAIVSGATFLLTQSLAALIALGMFAVLVIPLSTLYLCVAGWPRKLLTTYTVLMLLVGAGAIVWAMISEDFDSIGLFLFSAFALAALAAPWIANGLEMARPRH